jgi:hypothetical protein
LTKSNSARWFAKMLSRNTCLSSPSIILCASRYDRSMAISMLMPIIRESGENGEMKGKLLKLTAQMAMYIRILSSKDSKYENKHQIYANTPK